MSPWEDDFYLFVWGSLINPLGSYLYEKYNGFAQEKDSDAKLFVQRTNCLNDLQKRWIESADTFFIATQHTNAGADVSHRGGCPGFVQAEGAFRLIFPDYPGNNMFNTLGNLEVNSQAGLLFLDIRNGHMLQLSGAACVNWNHDDIQRFLGSERLVFFPSGRRSSTDKSNSGQMVLRGIFSV